MSKRVHTASYAELEATVKKLRLDSERGTLSAANRERLRLLEDDLANTAGPQASPSQHIDPIARRSIYYHAVFNPTGAPPPGRAYAEQPPLPPAEEDPELTGIPLPEGDPPKYATLGAISAERQRREHLYDEHRLKTGQLNRQQRRAVLRRLAGENGGTNETE